MTKFIEVDLAGWDTLAVRILNRSVFGMVEVGVSIDTKQVDEKLARYYLWVSQPLLAHQ
jgi:hypothetical protein